MITKVIYTTLHFIFMGFLGGVLYILIRAKRKRDLYKFDSIKHLIIGAIIGYIYSILYSEYNFPNSIMCLVAGYMGADFIKALVERFRMAIK